MSLTRRRRRGRLIRLVALGFLGVLLSACQQANEGVDLTAARGCLAQKGYSQVQSPDLESSLPGFAAPNLAMQRESLKIEAIVNGDTARAQRRLADLRGALQGLGVQDGADRVARVGNAVLVFTPTPSTGERSEAVSCFR